jgi:hypothetical protein
MMKLICHKDRRLCWAQMTTKKQVHSTDSDTTQINSSECFTAVFCTYFPKMKVSFLVTSLSVYPSVCPPLIRFESLGKSSWYLVRRWCHSRGPRCNNFWLRIFNRFKMVEVRNCWLWVRFWASHSNSLGTFDFCVIWLHHIQSLTNVTMATNACNLLSAENDIKALMLPWQPELVIYFTAKPSYGCCWL